LPMLLAVMLITLGAGVLAVVGWVLQYFVRLVTNLFLSISLEASNGNHAGPPSERVEFPAADGADIGGLFATGGPAPCGCVIFCGEFGADVSSWVNYVGWLVDDGWDVLALQFRGEGPCPDGKDFIPRIWVTNREVADIHGAIDWVRNRPGFGGTLALMGVSRGASAALVAASGRSEVGAVISDGGFSTRRTLMDYMGRWVSIYAWIPLIYKNIPVWFFRWLGWTSIKIAQMRAQVKFLDVRKSLAGLHAPALFIHGQNDSYISADEARALYADCAGSSKELWIVPDCRHNQASVLAADAYRERIGTFLARELEGARKSASAEARQGS